MRARYAKPVRDALAAKAVPDGSTLTRWATQNGLLRCFLSPREEVAACARITGIYLCPRWGRINIAGLTHG